MLSKLSKFSQLSKLSKLSKSSKSSKLIIPAKQPNSYVFKSLVTGSRKDSREETPQATTEHLVADR